MVWARGHRNDWADFAAESGNAAWSYASVLDIYRRVEDYHGAPDALRRGAGGPVHVTSARDAQPIAHAMVDAAGAMGIPTFDNPNGEMMEGRGGAALNDLIVKEGQRHSMYRAYVHPVRARPNLTVLTDTLVIRLVFEGKRVIGVEAIRDGRTERFTAEREVILSLGAIARPSCLCSPVWGRRRNWRATASPWSSTCQVSAPTTRTMCRSRSSLRTRPHRPLAMAVRSDALLEQ